MKPNVIILNGVARSGKDTVAKYIEKYYVKGLVHLSSTVDQFKTIAREHFGWDGVKDEAGRKLIHDLKMAYTRYNRFFIIDFIRRKQGQFIGNKDIAIIMAREPKELSQAKKYFGGKLITLLIDRPDIDVPNNDADQNVHDFGYDYVIYNDANLAHLEFETLFFLNEYYKEGLN